MKTPSLDLFNFIRSMSSAEKRYFKKDTRDSNTLDLFDIINEMEAYDEELVKNRLKDSSFAGNLKVHKNRLQQILLKNLRSFHEEKTAQSRISVLIDNAAIFQKKQMYDQAISQLDKAIQYCDVYEELELKLRALSIKSKIISNLGDFESNLISVFTDMAFCARQIQNYIHLASINGKIVQVLKNPILSGNEKSELFDTLINKEIKEKGEEALSTLAERVYLHSLAINSNLKSDISTAAALSKQIVDSFESNPYLIEEKNEAYLKSVSNYLEFSCKLPIAIKDFIIYLEKAESHAAIYEQLQPKLLYVYISYLKLLRKDLNFDTMSALYELKIKSLIENYQLENSHLAAKAQFMILEANLAQQNYDMVAKLIDQIMNSKKQISDEFYVAVCIVDMLYKYEHHQLDFSELIILSIHKNLRRVSFDSRFVDNINNLFLKISKSNFSEHKSLFQLFRTSITSYERDAFFNELNNYLDLGIWFDAQIRKQSYGYLVTEKKMR